MCITPKFGQKRAHAGPKMGQQLVFLPILSQGQFSPSELQEFEVRIYVRPNSPIINLILLTAFHKFARSRGPNTSLTAMVSTLVQPWKLVLSLNRSPFARRLWSRLGPLGLQEQLCSHCLVKMGTSGWISELPGLQNMRQRLAECFIWIEPKLPSSPSNGLELASPSTPARQRWW